MAKEVYVNIFSSIEIGVSENTPVIRLGYSKTPGQIEAGIEKLVFFSMTPEQAKAVGSMLFEAGTKIGSDNGTRN